MWTPLYKNKVFQSCSKRTIISVASAIFLIKSAVFYATLHQFYLVNSNTPGFFLNFENKLCLKGAALKRPNIHKGNTVTSSIKLLTDGEDPYQPQYNCRLHHYQFDDVTECLDRLSLTKKARQNCQLV